MSGTSFDIWAVLLIIGIFQGLFVLPLLFRKKTLSGVWLGALVSIMTAMMINHLLVNLRVYQLWPHFADLTVPFIFLIGPFYYFYIKSLLRRHARLKIADIKHFLLFFAAIYMRLDFYLLPGEVKINYLDYVLDSETLTVGFNFLIPIGIHVLQTLFYMYLVNRLLGELSVTSNESNIRFKRWLQGFTWAFSAYWVFSFLWLFYLTSAQAIFHQVDYVFALITALLVNMLAYVAIYHNKEFGQYLLAMANEKYKKSSLSNEQSKGLLKRIIRLMEEDKPYLNPDLKISDLANRLNTTTNIISQVLNQELKKNYFEFVNEYRISEAMRRLSEPDYSHISILGIAMDSGFRSKNTFNRLFKKHTSLTPSQFIRTKTL